MSIKLNLKYEYVGIYRLVNKKFSFVTITLKGIDIDVFVSSRDSLFSLDGDEVLVKIKKLGIGDRNYEGKVLRVIKRKTDKIIGVFCNSRQYGFVTPINKKIYFDIHINKNFFKKTTNNSIVVCKLLNVNTKNKNPEGMILETLGDKNEPEIQILSIIKSYDIKTEFNEDTICESKKISEVVEKNEYSYRKDLRDLMTVTIDGDDAKDLDDAISIKKLDNGNFKLYVSIADVSHYVKENTALDREALFRGNSVYLVDRVIPMLPKSLSNGICSLNEKVDRLTMTCEMEIDVDGNVVDSDIYESIINSDKRMTYFNVQKVIDGCEVKGYDEFKPMILLMRELSNILQKSRDREGYISFDLSESKIVVDENLHPIDIHAYETYESNKIIETFMVIANYTVAKKYFFSKIPFLYRVHEKCDSEKIKKLSMVLSNYKIFFDFTKDISAKQIQKVLKDVENEPYKFVIDKMVLRLMSQAKYSDTCLGHFALAIKYYTHFTSPIRRYNDLMIHRIIKQNIHNELNEKRISFYEKNLSNIAEHISKTERISIDCEREVEQYKKCEYMEDKIGNEYVGMISSVTNFGFYVLLDNTIEGLVPISTLKGFYDFYDDTMELVSEKNRDKFAIGMQVRVKVSSVDLGLRTIDFKYMERV